MKRHSDSKQNEYLLVSSTRATYSLPMWNLASSASKSTKSVGKKGYPATQPATGIMDSTVDYEVGRDAMGLCAVSERSNYSKRPLRRRPSYLRSPTKGRRHLLRCQARLVFGNDSGIGYPNGSSWHRNAHHNHNHNQKQIREDSYTTEIVQGVGNSTSTSRKTPDFITLFCGMRCRTDAAPISANTMYHAHWHRWGKETSPRVLLVDSMLSGTRTTDSELRSSRRVAPMPQLAPERSRSDCFHDSICGRASNLSSDRYRMQFPPVC